MLTMTLSACAGYIPFQQGQHLINQGKPADGISKLDEARKQAPDNLEFRQAFLNQRDQELDRILTAAQAALRNDKIDDAQSQVNVALEIDANNEKALALQTQVKMRKRNSARLEAAQAAYRQGDVDSASRLVHAILMEDPTNSGAASLREILREKEVHAAESSALGEAYRKNISIEFRDTPIGVVFDVIARTSGLNFIFDKDIHTDQKCTIFLKNSTIKSAIDVVLLANGLEQRALDANIVLIYPNSQAKQKEFQRLSVKSFFLVNAEAKNVAAAIKAMLQPREIFVDEKLNMLMMRDNKDTLRLAEKIVAIQDRAESEVMLEMEVLEVKRSDLTNLGIQLPSQVSFAPLSSLATGANQITLDKLKGLTSATIGVSPLSVTINANQQTANASVLANPRIRVKSKEKARILIGNRVPNITSTSTATGFVAESVSYIDVGLKLGVEPVVYLDNDVSIKLELEVSNIVGKTTTASGTVAYEIGTRDTSTSLRLKDGETQILAGLISSEDQTSNNGLPGLASIPLLGRLFGDRTHDRTKSEILLSITPHVIRPLERPKATDGEFDAGTEMNLKEFSLSRAGHEPADVATAPASARNDDANKPGASISSESTAVPDGKALKKVDPSPESAVVSWSGPSSVKTGDFFTVTLQMKSAKPIVSIPFAIGYDSKTLQGISVSEGSFLSQGNSKTSLSSRIDPKKSQIFGTVTRLSTGGATVQGSVIELKFRALSPAKSSEIRLSTASPVTDGGSTVVTEGVDAIQILVK